ncbi:MAG TPA: phospholipase D-like domain-containing protein [Ktedonobacterales bacterium]|nr:phospholipase D-like domain-containing protein [Ktedonobacterales bacterium]
MLGGRAATLCALAALLVLALAGCESTAPVNPGGPRQPAFPTPSGTAVVCVSPACAATDVQVFVEPDAGEAPILHAIEYASHSLTVEVYLLTDHTITRALEDAARRGVAVRVLLEAHPFGGGDVSAARTIEELSAAGVQAQPANPAYHFTHAKFLIVDGATLYVLTANLSRSALGGSSAQANREYGLIDTNTADVAEARAIFDADWRRTPTPPLADSRLVVSPVNARPTLAALIASAHTSLRVEDEEMYDTASEDALIAAAKRGVEVDVILPAPADGFAATTDVARLLRGGVHVRYLVAPYLHAKLLVADGVLAFAGSENFSATSLDENRELGLIVADPHALAVFASVFAQDWSLAQPP